LMMGMTDLVTSTPRLTLAAYCRKRSRRVRFGRNPRSAIMKGNDFPRVAGSSDHGAG
jgi:hypothetical protein